MREIKFRGKTIGSKEWVYGFYNEGLQPAAYGDIFSKSKILTNDKNVFVIPETVGQFTNLPYKIWENDIIQSRKYATAIYVVIWNNINCCFSALHITEYNVMNNEDDLFRLNMLCNKPNINPDWLSKYQFEPIGNLTDNPELLKTEQYKNRCK